MVFGRERSEMAPLFRTGLLFLGYLFSRCEILCAVVELKRPA